MVEETRFKSVWSIFALLQGQWGQKTIYCERSGEAGEQTNKYISLKNGQPNVTLVTL